MYIFYQDVLGSVIGTAPRYGPECLGIESPVGGEIFRTRPDRPWDPPSLLYIGYRVPFAGLKLSEGGVDHPPHSIADVKERVEAYPLSLWAFVTRSRLNFTSIRTD